MITKDIKITSIAVVMVFMLGIGFIGIPEADAAAVDKKLEKYAIQAADVKEKKDQAKDDNQKNKLDKEYKDLVKFLNRQGIATDEQFKEDPGYWIELRHQILEAENKDKNKSTSVSQVVYSGDSQITPVCGCSDALKLKASYTVYAWGFWWATYASSWTYVQDSQQGYSTIDFDDAANDHVKPFHYTQSQSAVKTINFDWDYVAHDAGWDEIDSALGTDNKYYPFLFTAYSHMMSELQDVETNSEFRFDVEVNSITP